MYTSVKPARAINSGFDWQLWRRWTVAMTLGELVGFAVPSLIGVVAVALGTSDLIFLFLISIAGMGEGAAVGFAQAMVLQRYLPGLSWRKWTLFTALAAGLVYFMAMLPNSVGDLSRFNLVLLIGGGIIFGLIALVAMGFAQWLLLRHYINRAGWWIGINAVAWPVGVMLPVFGLMAVPDGMGEVVFVVVGIICGVLMGALVGMLTGLGIIWLLRSDYQNSSATTQSLRHRQG